MKTIVLTQNTVVTHQHSGDPAILKKFLSTQFASVVTHQHSGDPAMIVMSILGGIALS